MAASGTEEGLRADEGGLGLSYSNLGLGGLYSGSGTVSEFYDGSLILNPLTSYLGLTIDKVNFLVSQLICLVLGIAYRTYLGPDKVSPTSRHVAQILIGIPLTYFCFGRQIMHLIAQSVLCLVMMRWLEPGLMENAVLIMAMVYLCVCHVYRLVYDYGGYTLDITGPLMLNTQRLSSLAFSLKDGMKRGKEADQMTKTMKQQAISDFPSLLEFFSYIFCFHGLMCGPFCFYKDYISFIRGTGHARASSANPCQPLMEDGKSSKLCGTSNGVVSCRIGKNIHTDFSKRNGTVSNGVKPGLSVKHDVCGQDGLKHEASINHDGFDNDILTPVDGICDGLKPLDSVNHDMWDGLKTGDSANHDLCNSDGVPSRNEDHSACNGDCSLKKNKDTGHPSSDHLNSNHCSLGKLDVVGKQVENHHTNNHRRESSVVISQPPNPAEALQQKLTTALCFGFMTIAVLPRFPINIITGPEFVEQSFLYKMFLVQLYAALQRQKYYFAWKLGESVNVAAGLGFNGYDETGKARWDLIDNADIYKVEFCTSLKELLDNWNKSTTAWLRYVVYERLNRTVPVFMFSALWHGFYAGYYMTFCTGGILIHTARLMRRHVRPLFQTSRGLRWVYDAMTFTATRIAIAYLGFPFLVLEFFPVLRIYCAVYFWMHISAILLAVSIIGGVKLMKRSTKKND